MSFKISKFVLMVTLSAFVGAVLVDPGDHILHLKLPLLILALVIWAVRVACGRVSPGSVMLWAATLLFAIILPGIAFIIALLGDSLPTGEAHFQIIKGFTVLLLVPVLVSEGIDLTKHIIRWSFVVAIITIALAAISIVAPVIYFAVYTFTLKTENAYILHRDLLGVGIGSFYYKTVSLVVFPIAYYFWNLLNRPRKVVSFVLTLIFLVAVLCSGSRATALGTFMVFVAFIFQKLKDRLGLRSALTALFIMVVLPTGYFASFFHPDESSNAIKLGHLRSYIVEFDENPTYLLWGQGTDTEFYTEGFQGKATLTELTYLDMIRWFGVPVSALILIVVLYPAFGLARQTKAVPYLAVPYVVYLWEAASNPLLICSFGALLVSAIWGVVLIHSCDEAIQMSAEALN